MIDGQFRETRHRDAAYNVGVEWMTNLDCQLARGELPVRQRTVLDPREFEL